MRTVGTHALLLRKLPSDISLVSIKEACECFGGRSYVHLPPTASQPVSGGAVALVDFGNLKPMQEALLAWTTKMPDSFGARASASEDPLGRVMRISAPKYFEVRTGAPPSRKASYPAGAKRPPPRNGGLKANVPPRNSFGANRGAGSAAAGSHWDPVDDRLRREVHRPRFVGPAALHPDRMMGRERDGFRERLERPRDQSFAERNHRLASEADRAGFEGKNRHGFYGHDRRAYHDAGRRDDGYYDDRHGEQGHRGYRYDRGSSWREDHPSRATQARIHDEHRSRATTEVGFTRDTDLHSVRVWVVNGSTLTRAQVGAYFMTLPACTNAKPPTVVPDSTGFVCGFASEVIRDRVWSDCKQCWPPLENTMPSIDAVGYGLIDGEIEGQCARFSRAKMSGSTAKVAVRLPPATGPATAMRTARASTPSSTQVPSHSPSARSSPQPGFVPRPASKEGQSVSPNKYLDHTQSGAAPRATKGATTTENKVMANIGSLPPPPPPREGVVHPPPGNPPRKPRSLRFLARDHGEELAFVYEECSLAVVQQLMLRAQPVINRASADIVRVGKREAGLRQQRLQRERAAAETLADTSLSPFPVKSHVAVPDGMSLYLASAEKAANARPPNDRRGNLLVNGGVDDDDADGLQSRNPDAMDCVNETIDGNESSRDAPREESLQQGERKRYDRSRKRSRRILDSDGEEVSDEEPDAEPDNFILHERVKESDDDVGADVDKLELPQRDVDVAHEDAVIEKKRKRSSKSKSSKLSKKEKHRHKKRKKRRDPADEDGVVSVGEGGAEVVHVPEVNAISPSTMVDDVDSPSGEEPSFEHDGPSDGTKQYPHSSGEAIKDSAVILAEALVNQDGDDCEEAATVKEGQCARTAGFLKSHLRKSKAAHVPEELEEQLEKRLKEAVMQAEAGGKSARGNRSAIRKLRQGLNEASLGADTMAMSFLSQRQKNLTFAKSRIHGMGLYSLEDIPAQEFLIEYVGEVIRRPLSEIRENAYEQAGMGDSYMFRLTTELVVDATRKGSIARFINHSCEPSVEAKIIPVNGAPKIVFYTKRAIRRGEELTYDYQFAYEDEDSKVACFCGAPTCRKSLN